MLDLLSTSYQLSSLKLPQHSNRYSYISNANYNNTIMHLNRDIVDINLKKINSVPGGLAEGYLPDSSPVRMQITTLDSLIAITKVIL